MKQGIFTTLENGTIHHDYSAYLETILGTSQIEGRIYYDLLFRESNLSKDKLSQVRSTVENSLGEDIEYPPALSTRFFERIDCVLPIRFSVRPGSEQHALFAASFSLTIPAGADRFYSSSSQHPSSWPYSSRDTTWVSGT